MYHQLLIFLSHFVTFRFYFRLHNPLIGILSFVFLLLLFTIFFLCNFYVPSKKSASKRFLQKKFWSFTSTSFCLFINWIFTITCSLLVTFFYFLQHFWFYKTCKYFLPILCIVSNIIEIHFYLTHFSDTWRVTSPEKEKEIPPLRVVSQSCVSLSLKKEVIELNWKRLKIGFLIKLEGTTWSITREIICTQLPSRTYDDAYPLLSSNFRTTNIFSHFLQ